MVLALTKRFISDLFKEADIRLNGNYPWDITVYNDSFFNRVFSYGTLGFGETYVDGFWESAELDTCITKLLKAKINTRIVGVSDIFDSLMAQFFNLQNAALSYLVGQVHYDIGNDLYSNMLDKRMVYSCGYWKAAENLNEAQEAKLDLLCRKINLKSGDRILDIGSGWGSFAKFAAENYGAEVVGITISKEQFDYSRELCVNLPVEFRLTDYRNLNEKFDHIVSVGMFEHVGYKNYKTFMEVVSRCLKDDGLFLLHTIGGNVSYKYMDPWIHKYIFPNSLIPSLKQISDAVEGLFVMEDLHNFGADYDKTLVSWFNNFNESWPKLKDHYGEKFYRMWKFYLLSCAGSFRSRHNELWQTVFSKNGVKSGYTSLR
jgi:cyclopropane-fatty-acyl-phospholipid synthase